MKLQQFADRIGEINAELKVAEAAIQECIDAEIAARRKTEEAQKTAASLRNELFGLRDDARRCVLKRNLALANEAAARANVPFHAFREMVVRSVRGKYASAWAEAICHRLQMTQLRGGLSQADLAAIWNSECHRHLSPKQSRRVWETLIEHCPARGATDEGKPRLGTPYPCTLDQKGQVAPFLKYLEGAA